MSDQDASTPRVFLVRHGETEWAKSGRFTGFTEIDITEAGKTQIASAAELSIGTGKLIDPDFLLKAFVSPRKRTRSTFNLLLPDPGNLEVDYSEEITEWDYGKYEGLTSGEIKTSRKQKGLDTERNWSIWRDGCEGGESMHDVTDRLTRFISKIRADQESRMDGKTPANILVVAHGLILRCLAKLWIGMKIDEDLAIIMDPGAIAVLSYKHGNVHEPALHLGMMLGKRP